MFSQLLKLTFLGGIALHLFPEFNYAQGSNYYWPIGDGGTQYPLSGLFMEYRSTGTSPHFHDGIDMPPVSSSERRVYPVADGTVASEPTTDFIRINHSVGTTAYLHITPTSGLHQGDPVDIFTIIGQIRTQENHLHFIEGANQSERNPLESGHLDPFVDSRSPVIVTSWGRNGTQLVQNIGNSNGVTPVEFTWDAVNNGYIVRGLVDILVRARDEISAAGENLGIYKVESKVYQGISEIWSGGPSEFLFWYNEPHYVYIQTLSTPCPNPSGCQFYYNTSNDLSQDDYFNSNSYSDGDYVVRVEVSDIRTISPTVGEVNMRINNTTHVEQLSDLVPTQFMVHQNYPNPFNPETKIRYQLPKSSYVVLKIYDMLGREIRTLAKGEQSAGYYEATWDGRDDAGRSAASGVYYYQLIAGEFVDRKSMVLLK